MTPMLATTADQSWSAWATDWISNLWDLFWALTMSVVQFLMDMVCTVFWPLAEPMIQALPDITWAASAIGTGLNILDPWVDWQIALSYFAALIGLWIITRIFRLIMFLIPGT